MRHQIPKIISQTFGQGSRNSQPPTAHCLYHTAELYYVLSPLAPTAKSAVAAVALISYFLPMELRQRHCPARITENYLMLKSWSLTNPLVKSTAVYAQEALQLKSSLGLNYLPETSVELKLATPFIYMTFFSNCDSTSITVELLCDDMSSVWNMLTLDTRAIKGHWFPLSPEV